MDTNNKVTVKPHGFLHSGLDIYRLWFQIKEKRLACLVGTNQIAFAWFWMKNPTKIVCEENESSFTWLKNQRLEVKWICALWAWKLLLFWSHSTSIFIIIVMVKLLTEFSALKCKTGVESFCIYRIAFVQYVSHSTVT